MSDAFTLRGQYKQGENIGFVFREVSSVFERDQQGSLKLIIDTRSNTQEDGPRHIIKEVVLDSRGVGCLKRHTGHEKDGAFVLQRSLLAKEFNSTGFYSMLSDIFEGLQASAKRDEGQGILNEADITALDALVTQISLGAIEVNNSNEGKTP